MKTHAKEQYFNTSASNPKLYWMILKQCIKSNKKSESIPLLKKISNIGEESFCFTDEDKCNCLNHYFVSTIDQSVNDTTKIPELPLKTNKILGTLFV